jgi:hypothetical protein
MKTMAAVMIVALAATLILAMDSPATAAAKPVRITIKASTAKAIVPALARCPVLKAGKPVTVILTPKTCKVYAAVVAKYPKLASVGPIKVTIKPRK